MLDVEASAAVARLYHEQTKHGGRHDRSRLVRFQPLDPTNRPAPFKRYVSLPVEPLPRDTERDFLARCLFFTAGVTRRSGDTSFRAAMSAGNLHPIEVYVADTEAVHHFAPLEFGLTELRRGSFSAGPVLIFTGIPWRTCWKYGERGYRHLFWDAGTMVANLVAVADAAGVATKIHTAFDDDAVSRLVGIDGRTEFPLVAVSLGNAPFELADDAPPIDVDVEPISRNPIGFPLVTEVNDAGKLDAGELAPSFDAFPLDAPIDDVIRRRGSTRVMRHASVPSIVDPGVAGVHSLVAVHAVDGHEPGLYDDGTAIITSTEGDVRGLSTMLCLDQPLGGDSAYTVFHAAHLDDYLERAGARGYRAATFLAGFAAGRVQLGATAAGLGSTGLTFFDDEVSRVFQTELSCLLVTAVGVPDYRAKPGGRPGAPTELTGYDQLSLRLARRLHR